MLRGFSILIHSLNEFSDAKNFLTSLNYKNDSSWNDPKLVKFISGHSGKLLVDLIGSEPDVFTLFFSDIDDDIKNFETFKNLEEFKKSELSKKPFDIRIRLKHNLSSVISEQENLQSKKAIIKKELTDLSLYKIGDYVSYNYVMEAIGDFTNQSGKGYIDWVGVLDDGEVVYNLYETSLDKPSVRKNLGYVKESDINGKISDFLR